MLYLVFIKICGSLTRIQWADSKHNSVFQNYAFLFHYFWWKVPADERFWSKSEKAKVCTKMEPCFWIIIFVDKFTFIIGYNLYSQIDYEYVVTKFPTILALIWILKSMCNFCLNFTNISLIISKLSNHFYNFLCFLISWMLLLELYISENP